MTNYFLDQFLRLKCAGDVWNAVAPVREPAKEISEAMAIIKRVKRLALNKPNHYALVDLCSGNALVPVIAAHLLPVVQAVAVDIAPRSRPTLANVRGFRYIHTDISRLDVALGIHDDGLWQHRLIITACHPCGNLAQHVIRAYKRLGNADALCMMPCCQDSAYKHAMPAAAVKKLGKYEAWAYYLAQQAGGTYWIESQCLSPCNAIVWAEK